jgi:hypothetical protein
MRKLKERLPFIAGNPMFTPGVRQAGIFNFIRGSRTSGITNNTFLKKDFLCGGFCGVEFDEFFDVFWVCCGSIGQFLYLKTMLMNEIAKAIYLIHPFFEYTFTIIKMFVMVDAPPVFAHFATNFGCVFVLN